MKTQIVKETIKTLTDADFDGETLQVILESIGMDYQMYKQLNVKYNNQERNERYDEIESLEMIHRLKMIEDDVKVLLNHLKNGYDMEDETKYADNGNTHINNIHTALDMGNNECLKWKKFNNQKLKL